jgi:ClpP class serine protease
VVQVTPFKKPTEEELQKQQEDIKMVYRQFANTVAVNRPDIDIDLVATGEVWYGPDALSRGLVDALQTSSEYIIEKVCGLSSCRPRADLCGNVLDESTAARIGDGFQNRRHDPLLPP